MKATFARPDFLWAFTAAGPPFIVTGFLWLTSENSVSVPQALLASALLYIPWFSYLRWKKLGHEVFPIFALISLMYWLYYGMPLFWTDRIVADLYSPIGRELPDGPITSALLMSLLGVCALWAGMKIASRLVTLNSLPNLALRQSQIKYLYFVMVGSLLLSFSESVPLLFGSGGRQMVFTLITVVPTLAFVVLLRTYLRGGANWIDKLLIVVFLGTRLVTGLSSGWLGAFASTILVCAAVYLAEYKKLPRLLAFTAIAFVLFFQVGKDDFRKAYWQKEGEPTGKIERVTFWTQISLEKWVEVANNPNGQTIRQALNPSVSRVSLLASAANVIDQTPSVVPYQYFTLYSYMAITLVPRFIWPDKPSMNEANQFYQVAYGLSTEEGLASVSIAVGVLAEGYISFGWPGAIAVMFLVGIFLNVYQRLLLSKNSGAFLTAIGIVMLPQILAVESQMAAYLGGIIQQAVFSLVIFWPAIRFASIAPRGSIRLAPVHNVVSNSRVRVGQG